MANLLDDVPDQVPERLTAGDTAIFSRLELVGDYPSSAYTLAFVLVADQGGTPVSTNASSGTWTLSAAVTGDLAAGRYRWAIVATRTSDSAKVTVERGELEVLSGLVGTVADQRSHARKVLEALEAAIENRASQTHLETELPDGRRVRSMTLEEQIKARDSYRRELRAEEAAERRRLGQAARTTMKTRL